LVLSQVVGVIILNGGLMIWARNTLQSFAVIMAGIASFMSLIYSYFLKRDDRVDNEE
jgi:4-hydroxybenzoate polyprenyltransferase